MLDGWGKRGDVTKNAGDKTDAKVCDLHRRVNHVLRWREVAVGLCEGSGILFWLQ